MAKKFTYHIGWGIFGRAGDITVTASEQDDGEGLQTRIRTTTSTRGFIRALYPFDGQADMFYDTNSGRFIRATAQTSTRSKEPTRTSRSTMIPPKQITPITSAKNDRSIFLSRRTIPPTSLPPSFKLAAGISSWVKVAKCRCFLTMSFTNL